MIPLYGQIPNQFNQVLIIIIIMIIMQSPAIVLFLNVNVSVQIGFNLKTFYNYKLYLRAFRSGSLCPSNNNVFRFVLKLSVFFSIILLPSRTFQSLCRLCPNILFTLKYWYDYSSSFTLSFFLLSKSLMLKSRLSWQCTMTILWMISSTLNVMLVSTFNKCNSRKSLRRMERTSLAAQFYNFWSLFRIFLPTLTYSELQYSGTSLQRTCFIADISL